MKKILLVLSLLAFTGVAANAQTTSGGGQSNTQSLVPAQLKTAFLTKANALKSALNSTDRQTAAQACSDVLMAMSNILGNYNGQLNDGASGSLQTALASKISIGNTAYSNIKGMSPDPIINKAGILSNLQTFTNSL